jgi:uncharacterized protein YdeI (YjbR/CyaY-like superfamily)
MVDSAPLPERTFSSVGAWSKWLSKNHSSSPGLWLKIAKKNTLTKSVSYSEALDVALCWGWIDGQKRPFNEVWWLQRFTPRKPTSRWSRINCKKAESLIAAGTMQARGLAEVERAKLDGRWKRAYDGSRISTPPKDLMVALDRHPRARKFFDSLDRANRYAILYRVQAAKKPETRAKLITRFVDLCQKHQTIHPRKQKG